jgi:NADH dehydrogenase FAD-containing subunit
MRPPTKEATEVGAERVVVVGGGYAGLATALGLAGRTRGQDIGITLVNPVARFTERLRLHQVAAGQQLAQLSIPDRCAGSGIEFVADRATAIDLDGRALRLEGGQELPFDVLVWATGSVADFARVPGACEHAFTLETMAGAQRLAVRLSELDEGSVVVAGGGLTGVEAAAELAESHPALRVTLMGAEVPGSRMGPSGQSYLLEVLDRLGVRVRAGVTVTTVLPDAVELTGGERVASDVTVWTGGVRCSQQPAEAGLEVDPRGRIVVDRTLRSVSDPSIYAVGDAAAVSLPFGVLHGTCQSGIPTGVHVAEVIARRLAGREPAPFRFGYVHQPVSLGRRDGVIQFTRADDTPRRMMLTGRAAARYKQAVSSSPWPIFGMLTRHPAVMRWSHGGQARGKAD